ncbi:outer membrane protein assembly factor BamD [Desulfobulbus alkaliphilus]|uniref:outer membrane protein assembly factor BamD n=1 Tax=Desulfobulbus alkaliphilus TaxID=869814 RepID=UPI0019627BDA|nr:outer membrane protein assembly factor BamD [Desulfobulbus alkaliphilus]MBM9536839.1 outer membrane protein assembly factor BamD [Desulfobulbus alkaliphilus]
MMKMRHSHPANHRLLALLLFLALTGFSLSGCATFEGMFSSFTFGEQQPALDQQPEMLLIKGMEAFDVGNYSAAIKAFNTILDEHPFSPQAMLAELKAADAHYYSGKYPEAKALYTAFEERYPTNEAIPYVLFQSGMSDFKRTDRIDRDKSSAQDAIQSFSRLLQAYPQSPYAGEARVKIEEAREFLINHEYMVAVFYVRTKRYDEAKHRLNYLLTVYPESTIAPKARALLDRLEADNPPVWGLGRWLPRFMTSERDSVDEEALTRTDLSPMGDGEYPGSDRD